MNTDKDYYNKLLEKINTDLNASAKFFIKNSNNIENYNDVTKEVLEQLNDCFFNNGNNVSALNNFDIYFYELLANIVVNSQPNIEQMRKIRSNIFKEQSINLVLDRINQENVDLTYSMISEHIFKDEKFALLHIESIFSIINDHINKKDVNNYFDEGEPTSDKLIFDKNKLKLSLQELLKNHYHFLKNDVVEDIEEDYDFDPFDSFDTSSQIENKTYSEQILDHIKKIFPSNVWHEFTNLLPVLPERAPNEPIFSINKCPIVELDINNRAVLGVYHDLMLEQDIYTMLNTTIMAMNVCSLPGIRYIKNTGFANEKEFSILVKSSDENLPPIEKVEKLLLAAFGFYHDFNDKNQLLNNKSNIYQKFIEKEWLDLSVPQSPKANINKKKI